MAYLNTERPLLSRFPSSARSGNRAAERRGLDATVRVREAGTADLPLPLTFHEMSASGGFVSSNLLLPVGAQLEMSFELPGYEPTVHADARVIRVNARGRQPGMGIVFDRMAPRARAHLRDIAAWA